MVCLQDGSLYAPNSPPYYDEYPFSMPPQTYLETRPADEEIVVSEVDFGYNTSSGGTLLCYGSPQAAGSDMAPAEDLQKV